MDFKQPQKTFTIPCLIFSVRMTPTRMLWRIIRRKYYLVFLGLISIVLFCWTLLTSKQAVQTSITWQEEFGPRKSHRSLQLVPKVPIKALKKQKPPVQKDDMNEQMMERLLSSDPYQGPSGRGSSVIINGRYRTGSSFIGSLFQYDPKVHYVFEPLQFHPLPFTDQRQAYIEKVAETRLREILDCDYNPIFKDVLSRGTAGVIRVKKWWGMAMCRSKAPGVKRCERNITKAVDSCKSKQHRVIKEITLSNFTSLVPLMKEGIKVIHLVRDPRGQVNSIMRMFKNTSLDITMVHFRWKLTEICAELRNTFRVVHETFTKDPRLMVNYKLVRYEDVAMAPLEKAEEIYKFANIEPDQYTLKTLKKTTTSNRGSYLSVSRNSSSIPFAWMNRLPLILKQVADYRCCDILHMLGYPRIDPYKKIDIETMELDPLKLDVTKPYKPSCPYDIDPPKPYLVLT